MTPATDITQAAIDRITQVIAKVKQENPVFQELKLEALTNEYAALLLDYWLPYQILDFSEEQIAQTIRNLMTWRMLYGLIADFPPEQMRVFDAAVES